MKEKNRLQLDVLTLPVKNRIAWPLFLSNNLILNQYRYSWGGHRRFPELHASFNGDTHRDQLRVDSQVLPVSTPHVGQHASRWQRRQEVANAWPWSVASAAEVRGDGIIHPVHILLLQTGCVGVATGKWRLRRRLGGGSSLTVTGRWKGCKGRTGKSHLKPMQECCRWVRLKHILENGPVKVRN